MGNGMDSISRLQVIDRFEPEIAEARPEQTGGAVPAWGPRCEGFAHQRSDLLPDIAVATDRPGQGDGVRLKAVVAAAGAVLMALDGSRPAGHTTAQGNWRRRRDSNPRCRFRHSGFQDRRLQPLGHSSGTSSVAEASRLRRLVWAAVCDRRVNAVLRTALPTAGGYRRAPARRCLTTRVCLRWSAGLWWSAQTARPLLRSSSVAEVSLLRRLVWTAATPSRHPGTAASHRSNPGARAEAAVQTQRAASAPVKMSIV